MSADYLPLAVFTLVSTITPGGATMLATASGAHFGYRRSLSLIVGIAVGLASMAAAAAAGLGSIIFAIPSLQFTMKLVGTIYLLWLAWSIARGGAPKHQTTAKPTGFFTAVWLAWYNPKGWAVVLGAAASFATLSSNPVFLGTVTGLSFGLAAMSSLSIWCVAGVVLARLLRNDTHWRILNISLGILLAASVVPMWLD